jgi:hypothetical protein
MGRLNHVLEKISEADEIELSAHAERRAKIRGIKPERVLEAVRKGELLGALPNENPNVEIKYSESYLVLIKSASNELFYLPVYFKGDKLLITTVLKFSESNIDLEEW